MNRQVILILLLIASAITHNLKIIEEGKTDKIWQGWVVRESGKEGFRQVLGDHGNAWGKYQFDRRYGLVPFMQYCKDFKSSHYSGFQKFIDMGPGSEELLGNQELAALWLSYCDAYPKEFEMLQDVNGYKDYYIEVRKYLQNLYGIRLDNHSPSLKGSAFSMAIRSGPLNAAWRYKGFNDSSKDMDMLLASYATYGDEDAERWTRAKQLGDAIVALETGNYTEVPIEVIDDPTEITKIVKVNADVERRKGPSESAEVVGKYTAGTLVDVVAKIENFYLDVEGTYFSAKNEYVEDAYGEVKEDLHVRSKPSADATIVAYLAKGAKIPLLKRQNGWYFLKTNKDVMGWSNGNYIDVL